MMPVRFNYCYNQLNFNTFNAAQAIGNLELTPYSGLRGNNSPHALFLDCV